jgi:1,4-alpha-glucan branching enzyme
MAAKPQKKTPLSKVEFVLEAPEAQTVYLAGSFNDWSIEKHPMKKNNGSPWKKSLLLPPGEHEYKFWVDGHWTEDPQNERRRPNRFGTLNSIVKVV